MLCLQSLFARANTHKHMAKRRMGGAIDRRSIDRSFVRSFARSVGHKDNYNLLHADGSMAMVLPATTTIRPFSLTSRRTRVDHVSAVQPVNAIGSQSKTPPVVSAIASSTPHVLLVHIDVVCGRPTKAFIFLCFVCEWISIASSLHLIADTNCTCISVVGLINLKAYTHIQRASFLIDIIPFLASVERGSVRTVFFPVCPAIRERT